MRRSNNGVKYLAAVVAIVAVCVPVGYLLAGRSQPTTPAPENVIPQSLPSDTPAPQPKPARVAITPRATNGDYTAPGAPHVEITEERTPSLIDTSNQQPKADKTPASTPDAEASQEAAPTPKDTDITTPTDTSPDPDSTTVPDGSPNAPVTPPAPPADSNSPVPPPATPAQPSDPDVEQIGTGHTDPEASQQGDTTAKSQFRVQTGSFATADNAKTLADALHRRGYATSTHSERDGDKTVYKVQIGAYRNRAAADKAAQDLQSSGYPAYVSPIAP